MPPAPPGTDELADRFPRRLVRAGFPFWRIHDETLEPEWFCADRHCRFDPPADEAFGTCYAAGNPLGAFVERFGRLRIIPRRLVEAKALSRLELPSDLAVADATDRRIVGRYGLTAELWAGETTSPARRRGRQPSSRRASPASGTRAATTPPATSTPSRSSASPASSPRRS